MPTPSQIRSRYVMRCIAKGVIYGLSTKVLAQKFKKTPAWVLSVQKHVLFESILKEVEEEIYRSSDREIASLRAESFKVLHHLLKSKSEKTLLGAIDRVQKICDLREGLGAGGAGAAVEEDEDEGDYLLSDGAIDTAFRLLENTSKEEDYINVSSISEKGKRREGNK